MKNSKPSRTALLVAAGVVYAASDPILRELVDPEAVTVVRQMLQSSRSRLLSLVESRIGRTMIRLIERWTIPGIIRHWNCRKRWLARTWGIASKDGFDTLVILGSGFDALSWRAVQLGNGAVRTIDVDHPATLAAPREALSQFKCPTHTFIAHDLSRSGISQALDNAIPDGRSIFVVIEGVLMYLEPHRVRELFRELAHLKARRVRIAFSFMDTTGASPPAFRPRSRMVDVWLRMHGEPFRSGLDSETLGAWLRDFAFQLIDFAPTPDQASSEREPLRGECVALAERLGPTPAHRPKPRDRAE